MSHVRRPPRKKVTKSASQILAADSRGLARSSLPPLTTLFRRLLHSAQPNAKSSSSQLAYAAIITRRKRLAGKIVNSFMGSSADSERDLLEACMSMPHDGAAEDMFEDLEQVPRRQGSTPHSSVGSDAASGLSQPFATAPVTGALAGPHQQARASPTLNTTTAQAQVQVQPHLSRAFSEPPVGGLFPAQGNCRTTSTGPTAGNWFSRAQQQKQPADISEAEHLSDDAALFGPGLHLHRLYSDMSPGAQAQQQQQQWTPAGGAQNAALAMLLAPEQGGARRHSMSSMSEAPQQSTNPLNPLLASLTHEQQQLLVNAGLEPSLLLSAARSPVPAPSADPQLDTAEAIWQHVAASGADDQTLLTLAAGLGLITTDATSGAVVLTREVALRQHQRQPNPLSSPQQPHSARNSLYGGAGLAPGSPPSKSSPLPRLSQPGLAGLLALQASINNGTLRLPAGSPGLKGLGSSPGPSKQHTLYKTELCRGWIETGTCRYGSKCQFAHGRDELRPVPRHPKYKTEVCRSFTATGVCAYGPRCRFIHGPVSAPNAMFDAHGLSSRLGGGDSGMEGVLGFDDPATSPGGPISAAETSGAGPRRQLLSAASGGSAALRQAAGNNTAAAAHDAASMAKIAARLLAVSGRASLDSSMSMTTVNRLSMSEQNRASMDSRVGGYQAAATGGRMSLESCMSQGDMVFAREMLMGGANSNERLNGASSNEKLNYVDTSSGCYSSPSHHSSLTTDSLLSLSASLAAAAGTGHQPFMPGIPEGCAMNINTLPVDPWAGIPTAGSQAMQQQQQQRMANEGAPYSMPFGFLLPRAGGMGGQECGELGGYLSGNLPSAPGGASGGTWWDPAGNQTATNQRAVAEHLVASNMHMSAYQSNLYASHTATAAQQQQQMAAARKQNQGHVSPAPRGSYPGLLTPEKSESSLEPTSDANLKA